MKKITLFNLKALTIISICFIVSNFFDSQPIYALVTGGVSMILAGFLTLRVSDEAEVDIKETE